MIFLVDPNTNELLGMSSEVPVILYRDPVQQMVTIRLLPIWQLAHVVNLGDNTTLSESDSALKVTPSRIRLGRVASHTEQGAFSMQQAPDDNTDPTWQHTKLSVTSTGAVGIGIGVPQDGARLHVLGDVLCNNLTTTILNANNLQFTDGSYLSERLSIGPSWTTFTSVTSHVIPLSGDPFQEYRIHLEKDAPTQASQLLLKALKADGTVATISYNSWRLGSGW